MAEWFQAIGLAILQGITEFLPISSSGHLALVPSIFGWPDQGLVFDVAVHVGTLIAVIIYFRNDLSLILCDWVKSLTTGKSTTHSKLAWAIAVATIMIGIAGLLLEEWVVSSGRNPVSIAVATIFFGVLLGLADRYGEKDRAIENIQWKDVIFIGAAQMLALIPGTSRSGVTISAGLMMGLSRDAATRFSFLMAIPVISLSGIWQLRRISQQSVPDEWQIKWGVLALAVIVSAVIAYLCVHYFLQFVQRFSMLPFVVYRLVLGVILLVVFL